MNARMKNPALVLPEARRALEALHAAGEGTSLPPAILALTHLRASQINGCSFCVDLGVRMARKAGEQDTRLFTVAAWRDAPGFTEAERAALALTEAVTRVADRSDPVPDRVWDVAAKYFDQQELAALLLNIAITNAVNRLNTSTRQQ